MAGRFARYQKVAALADEPTPFRRLVAAVVAGAFAFVLTHLLLGGWWGVDSGAVVFSSFGLAVAAAVAALTMKRAMAVVYGVIGAMWLLLECVALVLGCLLAVLG